MGVGTGVGGAWNSLERVGRQELISAYIIKSERQRFCNASFNLDVHLGTFVTFCFMNCHNSSGDYK